MGKSLSLFWGGERVVLFWLFLGLLVWGVAMGVVVEVATPSCGF